MEPSEGTLKALKEEDEEKEDGEDGEDEGTAKIAGQVKPAEPPSPSTSANGPERFGSVSQSRLSSMFDGWLRSTSPSPSSPPNRNSAIRVTNSRMSVSEPKLVEQHTGSSIFSGASVEASDDEEDFDASFEKMLVSENGLLK